MTTIRETLHKRLMDYGMFDMQAETVLDRIADEPDDPMAGRWNDRAEDYPPVMFDVLWLAVSREALAYIDEAHPQAWFRDMFVPMGKATN